MTMFTADNRRCGGGYGKGFRGYGWGVDVRSDSGLMGEEEEESTTQTRNDVARSSNREDELDHDTWLQLSIGPNHNNGPPTPRNRVELELMPSSSNNTIGNEHRQLRPPYAAVTEIQGPRPAMNDFTGPPVWFQNTIVNSSSSNLPPHPDLNWAFRPVVPFGLATDSSSMAPEPALGRPFQMYAGVDTKAVRTGVDFRVVPPPRRPHSGIWFMLQASQMQGKKPYLPQIAKSYLRIKDGRMTIALVIKYLVHKLRLENESEDRTRILELWTRHKYDVVLWGEEIEIRCKGQRLMPCLSLQHVRDNIWSSNPRDFITLLPTSSTAHHIMVLHYGRINSNRIK